MNKVKIWFSGETNERMLMTHPLIRALSKRFNVVLTEKCDFLFVGYKDYVYGREFLKHDCVRILFSTENIYPDYNIIDYALCPNHCVAGDRFLWLPYYWWDDDSWKLVNSPNPALDWEKRDKFCCFIVSNNNAEPSRTDPTRSNRELFFDELSEYKKVDSPGRFKNNMPAIEVDPASGKTFYSAKIDFMRQYRFALAFENSSSPGYTTEKIVHAYLAGCIPIYWGDMKIAEQFKEGTFVWIKDEDDVRNAIKKITRLDNGKDSALPFISPHPKYLPLFEKICSSDYVGDFLSQVLSQEPERARRRSKYYLNQRYEGNLSVGLDFRPDTSFDLAVVNIPPEQYLGHTPNVSISYSEGSYNVEIEGDWKGYIQTFGGRFKLPAPVKARKMVELSDDVEKIRFSCHFEAELPVIVTPYIMQYDEEGDLKSDFKDSTPSLTGEVAVDAKKHEKATNFKIAVRFIRQDRKNESFKTKIDKVEVVLKNKKKE